MKQLVFSLILLCFVGVNAFSQCDCKVNMSFERAEGGCFGQNCNCNCLPDNGQDSWEQCTDWGCGSTDIEPGGNLTIGNIKPSDGKTFMSMTCGPNGEGNALKLCAGAPLKSGTKYCFSIDLLTKGGNTALALYGSNSACTTSELLWKSATVTSATWTTQTFCFTPTSNWTYISFRVIEGSGALGLDNWKSTDGNFPPQPDNSTCEPTVTVRDTTVCANGCTKLTAIGKGGKPGYTYKWSDGQTGQTIDVCPGTTTKTLTVTLTDAANKTAIASGKVVIAAAPAVSVSPASICAGESTALTATGATTYSWSPNTGLSGTTGSSVTASPATTTTYTVVGSNGGGCKDTATVVVTVNPKPKLTATGGQICPGDSVQLNVTDANATTGISYSWQPAGTLSNPAIANPYAHPTANITYTVTGKTDKGCTATATATVNISNSIIPNVSADTSMCIGSSAQLKASGGSKYVWTPATGLSSTTISNPIATPTVTTVYEVEVSSGTCIGKKSVTVKVNPLPTVTAADASMCGSEKATISATGASTYKWTGTGIPVTQGASITVSPAATATYTVVGTDINGCVDTATSTVTVKQAPVITVNSVTICIGETTSLTATGGTSYDWTASSGGALPSGPTITVKPTVTTTYTVTGTGVNGCKNTAVGKISVNPAPDVKVNSGTICKGTTFTLTATGGALTYTWQASDGSPMPNSDVVIVTPTGNTTYTVTGTTGGCTDTAIAHVNVNAVPVITVNNGEVCERQEVLLTATGGTSYVWSTGGKTPTIVVTPTTTTSYTVTGTTAGCSSKAVAVVTVYGKPYANFYPSVRELSDDEPKVALLNGSNGKNLIYDWNFGDPVSGALNTSKLMNPSHLYSHTGIYSICLKATDSLHGCADSICKEIVYKPQWTFYIPNAFTPGDPLNTLNNTFNGKGTNIMKYSLMIFDRWGTKIFETTDLEKGWDGRVQGKPEIAQQDVYVWKVDLTDPFNKEHHYVGHVTLLR
ncbi:MAG TPA: gliding motility-associated C-terminal domain-containing protein [Bacteroidia bacterium]|nr:gliding motility-associated C-terminal domain-containing protein [Bacteroidia bacterium]